MKKIFMICLIALSSSAWATGGGLGGMPSPTTPFVRVAVCLDVNGKPISQTQHLKQQHSCEKTDKANIDKINNK